MDNICSWLEAAKADSARGVTVAPLAMALEPQKILDPPNGLLVARQGLLLPRAQACHDLPPHGMAVNGTALPAGPEPTSRSEGTAAEEEDEHHGWTRKGDQGQGGEVGDQVKINAHESARR